MKIELKQITIKDVADGYKNDDEEGVVGYGGKLNIRPKYQREFVYKDDKRNAVMDTIKKEFPLNVMYWVKNKDGSLEVLDGQQRTISFCEYIDGKFSMDFGSGAQYFNNLTDPDQKQILDYKLMIYFCEGDDKEKLAWFKIVNISGERLYEQELRNAIFTGPWLTDAKRYFSKSNCAAYGMASDYLKGSPIRQDYLEAVIEWISNGDIQEYMAKHQFEKDANELWEYFQNVINWVKEIFPNYRKEMKGIDWGFLYNEFKNKKLDAKKLEKEITELMQDEDVSKKSGIYPYVLTRNEKYLSIRAFSDKMKREAYERQKGICPKCKEKFEIGEMEADHIKLWSDGGKTISENCQMLCKDCHREKSNK